MHTLPLAGLEQTPYIGRIYVISTPIGGSLFKRRLIGAGRLARGERSNPVFKTENARARFGCAKLGSTTPFAFLDWKIRPGLNRDSVITLVWGLLDYFR